MLRFSISQLPNGKYYGELFSKGKDSVMSADVVDLSMFNMRVKLGKQAAYIISISIKSFVTWRINSIEKAGREIWTKTQDSLGYLSNIGSSINTTQNLDAIARKTASMRKAMEFVKPKTKCHLYDELEQFVIWAEVFMANKNVPQIEVPDKK